MNFFFRNAERGRLLTEVAALKAERDRLQQILDERDRLVAELRQALGGDRQRPPFISIGGESDGGAGYERATPAWL